ncbi:MAG: helix-turn-helix domain-containing protein [Candidatus Methanomethylophilaceae archaeon]|nr:helix-turn-helix domain-containing protein [Candidatus Methanomethylophilaceae archaeon]
MRNELREKIAGEIALSANPGKTIRKWREDFGLSQQELAIQMGISPSVISDYESGRRKSPGIVIVRKIVDSLLALDDEHGSPMLKKYELGGRSDCVVSISEFKGGMPMVDFMDAIEAHNVVPNADLSKRVHGYTVVNSIKAIVSLNSADYLKIYGWSSERALIFTDVIYGRSPMIAIRAHPLTPAMVVYHKPENIDPLAIKLAQLEGIPLVVTNLEIEELIRRLERMN